MALTWNDIFTTGSLIHFSRHQWQARAELTDKDLGIEPAPAELNEDGTVKKKGEKIVNQTIRLAHAKRFERINQKMRAFIAEIEARSLNFPVLESVRYVPDAQVATLRTNLENINREFEAAVDAFVADFPQIKTEGLDFVTRDLYKSGRCRTAEHATAAIARITADYPDANAVAAKFGLEYDFFTIQLPVSEAAAAAAKDAAPQVKSVVESMLKQLRSEVSEKLTTLLRLTDEARKANGTLNMKSINSALDVLSKVDSLNFLGDETLIQQVSMVRSMLQNAKDAKEAKQDANLSELFSGLSKAQEAVSADVQAAVSAAEKKLTGLGARKIG
jgi:hypothetical protein